MKVTCILALYLPVQVERQHNPSLAECPLVVGGRSWDAGAVLDCCPQAEAAGVTSGMRLSQAETLCPTARFVHAHEELYRVAHDTLVAAAGCFTPTVETAGLGLLYAEVSGLEQRFGSDTRLAHQMALEASQALRPSSGQASGLDVRVGLDGGKFVTEQAARAARPGSGRRGAVAETGAGDQRADAQGDSAGGFAVSSAERWRWSEVAPRPPQEHGEEQPGRDLEQERCADAILSDSPPIPAKPTSHTFRTWNVWARIWNVE